MKKYILLLALIATTALSAQAPFPDGIRLSKGIIPYPTGTYANKMGFGTLTPTAAFDFTSTTGGFLFPRMTTTQRDAIVSPATSLVIRNTTTGLYEYFDGSVWKTFGSGATLQEVAEAGNTYTDGTNALIINPKSLVNSVDLSDNTDASHAIVDVSGAVAIMQIDNSGGDYIASMQVLSPTGSGTSMFSDGSIVQEIDGFKSILRVDNITSDRTNQRPDANGVFGVSVKVNGVDYPFNNSGNTSDIVISAGSGTVTNVSGTPGRIAITNPTTTPGVDIDAAYIGQTSLTTLGTVTTGTWQATPIAASYGGTGTTSLGSGIPTFLTTPSSANFAAAVTDETGSGGLVFANSPTLITPNLGTPASGVLTNATGLPQAGVVNLVTDLAAKQATIQGATGIASIGTAMQLIRVNSAATALEYYTPAYPKKTTTYGTALTGVTTEDILYSIPITGGDFVAGNLMYINAALSKTGTAGTTTIRFKVNTSNAIAGATQISTFTTGATSLSFNMERTLSFQSGNVLDFYPPTQAAVSDKATPSAIARSTTSLDPSTTWYLLITGQNSSAADSSRGANYFIERK